MSLPALIALILGLSLTAYALFAGADFGAGILDLLARHRDAERGAIAATIGPVWEANHVWLIFVITVSWTAYPTFLGSLASTLASTLCAQNSLGQPRRVAPGVQIRRHRPHGALSAGPDPRASNFKCLCRKQHKNRTGSAAGCASGVSPNTGSRLRILASRKH